MNELTSTPGAFMTMASWFEVGTKGVSSHAGNVKNEYDVATNKQNRLFARILLRFVFIN